MDFIWILFAFILGLASRKISLPPSIGYLACGFILHFLGYSASPELQVLADLGITLMLFTIGLKLNVRDLVKNEVWLGCISHTLLWMIFAVVTIKILVIASLAILAIYLTIQY